MCDIRSFAPSGDLLRAERKSGGENAALIEEFIEAGKIVPVSITVALIKKAMDAHIFAGSDPNFLVDGFPRNVDNWEGWQEVFRSDAKKKNTSGAPEGAKGEEAAEGKAREAEEGEDSTPMPSMLFFECPLEVLEKRILGRAKFTGRSDDNVESLRKRFVTYKVRLVLEPNVLSSTPYDLLHHTPILRDHGYCAAAQ